MGAKVERYVRLLRERVLRLPTNSTTVYFDGENVASQLRVVHSAPVGTSWSAAPGVTGWVDSITEVILRERLTSVKYISLPDSTSNHVLATLPLSRDLGLLVATNFYRLRAIDQWSSPLVSINTPALGPQLPSLNDIFNLPVGTQLSVGEVRNETFNGGGPCDLSVSTRRFTNNERIRLYPNPASNNVTVEVPEDPDPVSLCLISADGRLVQNLNRRRGNQTITLGALTTGIYTVVVANEQALIGRRRLVVR